MQTFRYLYHTRRHPKMKELLFALGGLALEKRQKKLNKHWQIHLSKCKQIQEEFFANKNQEHTLILGAGRLFDVNSQAIIKASSQLSLFDADPLCLTSWKALQRKHKTQCNIDFQIADISNCIYEWKKSLDEVVFKNQLSFSQTLQHLENIALDFNQKSNFLKTKSASTIVSLNLLSQIPIHWQNIVERSLIKRFGKKFIQENEAAWFDAIIPSAQALIKQHLKDLNQSSAKNILLFTDTQYILENKHGKEHVDALYGLDLTKLENAQAFFSNRAELKLVDSWQWTSHPKAVN